MASYLRSELEVGGFPGDPDVEVRSAATLGEAVGELRRGAVGLVLLDVGLPDSSGLDSVSAVVDVAGPVPVVVITGSEDEQFGDRSLRAGAVGFVSKASSDGRTIWRAVRHGLVRAERQAALLDELAEARRAHDDAEVLEGLHAGTGAARTVMGLASLRERTPAAFGAAVDRYADLVLEAADGGWRTSLAARALAHDLGGMRAHPRDVAEIHVAAVQAVIGRRATTTAGALLARSRGVLVQVLGELAGYYLQQLAGVGPARPGAEGASG